MLSFEKLSVAALLALPLALVAGTDGEIKRDNSTPEYTTTHEMAEETKATVQCLQYLHITKKPLNQIDSDDIIRSYIGNLDALHLFFTEEEIKNYQERYSPMLDYYCAKGSLLPGFAIYKNFLARVDERIAWINKRLENPVALDTDKTYVRDRSKALWPKNRTDADRLWEERLTLDLVIELLGDTAKPATGNKRIDAKQPPEPKGKNKIAPENPTPEAVADAVKKIRKRYNKIADYLRLEAYEVEEIFLNTLAAQYDPHSSFFSKQSLEEFEIAMRNSLKGVGALLQDDEGYCTIREIIPGGPIEESKRLKVGDRIVAIGQGEDGDLIDIVGMRLNKVVNRLRGPADTIVRLRVEPASDHTARYTITLKRKEIKLTTKLAQASIVEVPSPNGETVPVGVVDLPAFYGKTGEGTAGGNTAEDVEELIGKLKKHNIRALVLDLRRNGGGLLDEAVKLAGLFIPSGPVLQIKNSLGKTEHLDDKDPKVAWDGPLVILVSKLSASASEIVAGALKDHKRAVIVGDKNSHGKGTVQTVIPFDRLSKDLALKSAIKITVQKWYLPGGNSIQLKGIDSDIVVPSVYSVLPVAESDLEHPIQWDSVASVLPTEPPAATMKTLVTPELLKELNEAGALRQAEIPEFTILSRLIAWTKSREKTREIPLSYTKLRVERIDDKAFRESIRAAYKELESEKFKTEPVKLDVALEQEKKEEKPADKKDENADEEDEDEIADTPDADVQLREALRIAGDWSRILAPAPKNDAPATVATKTPLP